MLTPWMVAAQFSFNLAPVADSIVNATLKLYPLTVKNAPEHEATLTSIVWAADTLNWNNRPPVGAPVETWTPVEGTPTSINLTPEALAVWASADSLLQIRIGSVDAGDNTQWVNYASIEHANTSYHPVLEITTVGGGAKIEQSISVESGDELPDRFSVEGNYPNPFNPTTTLLINLSQDAVVQVEVYDLMGRRVLVLSPRNMAAGKHQRVAIDATSLASGVYLYRVTAQMKDELTTRVGRMTFLK